MEPLAHPLNAAPASTRRSVNVVAGYGVLQPRVSFHLVAATHSRFAALLAASGGIDPYATAASDAYMDLFGLGSFTGKGIYDLDAFEAATGKTFPVDQILSHDLIEGNYARCGLASDTELFDDFPARYHAYARREHRWVRGDWQLLPWLGPWVPSVEGRRRNPLPLLERWKLFDNLRRSLVAPALVLLLVLGWMVFPGSPWLWTAVALAVPAFPLLQVIGGTLFSAVRKGSFPGAAEAAQRDSQRGDRRPGPALDRVSGQSGPARARCDHADARPPLHHPPAHAGVGDRRVDRTAARCRRARLRREHVARAGTFLARGPAAVVVAASIPRLVSVLPGAGRLAALAFARVLACRSPERRPNRR